MAESTGMVIPKAASTGVVELQNIDLTSSSIEVMLETFFNFSKKDQERMSKQLESVIEYNKQISDLVEPNPKDILIGRKNSKYIQDKIVKKDFVKALFKSLKMLIDRAGGWLKTLLEVLLFFAVFDPDGSMLNGIFDMIVNMLTKVLNYLIPKIPNIAKRMWKLFWDVVVSGFGNIGQALGEALFGKGDLADFMGDLGKLAPIFIAVAGTISYLIPIIEGVAAVIGFLGAPVFAIIAAIVIAIGLIWIFRDKIATFFEVTLPKWFKGLGIRMKILVGILLIAASPFIAIVYGLAKLFQSFKKIGFKATMKPIYNAIATGLKGVATWLKGVATWLKGVSFTKILLAIFLGMPGLLIKALISGTGKLLSWLGGLLGRLLKKLWPNGFAGLMKVIDIISDVLTSMSDWINAFFTDPMAWLSPTMSDKESNRRKSTAMSAVEIKRLSEGTDIERTGALSVAKMAGIDSLEGMTSRQIQAALEKAHASTAKGSASAYDFRQKIVTVEKQAKSFEKNNEQKNG